MGNGAMKFISFDPGNTTGWAFFEDALPTEFQEMQIEQLYDFLNQDDTYWKQERPVEAVVIEDYIVRPQPYKGFDHNFSRVPTAQVIGAITCWAQRLNVPVHLVQPSELLPGAKRFGLPDPARKSLAHRNAISAIIHGRLFFERYSKQQIKLLER